MKSSEVTTVSLLPEGVPSVEDLFYQAEQRVFRRTDRVFLILFGIQWLAGILFALFVSPRAWAGSVSSIHVHIYAALGLGGICCLVPMYYCWRRPGQAITRHIVAIGQTAFSGLLIHLTGGRIETHFHIFGSLAFLACYRDWRVLITATVVVAADHFIRGIWYPMSVYGVVLASPWRVAEHALWVVFEDIILIWSCHVSRNDIFAIAEKENQNARLLAQMETRVQERTAALEAEVAERCRVEMATRASEERYRTLVINSPQIIMTVDRTFAIRYINRTPEGFAEADVLASNFIDYHPSLTDREKVRKALEDVFDYGQTRTLEVVGPGPKGTSAWYSLTLAPARTEDKIDSCIILATDITERHDTEAELIQARDLAEAGNRAKSEFLATMSHELRTPMNGVIGFTNLLFDTPLNDEQREFVGTIRTSGEALLNIINDILDISKIESGKFGLENTLFNLREMIEEVGEMMLPRAEEKGLELTIWHAPDAPSVLQSDPGRFRQVLLNLVNNAIKFTETGYVHIEVDTVPNAATPEVRINVRDTGIGIPREKHSLLFQKFSQVDGSTTRKFGGTGLGLAICKQLIELMGGKIGLESSPGHGSTFWITHPAAGAIDPGALPATAAPPDQSIDGLRILIVDDLEINRRVLQEQLLRWRIPHESASSGPLALEILRRAAGEGRRYQIALVDHLMPHMDGVMFAERVKADPAIAKTGLIMLTSGSMRADARSMLSKGFDQYLCKPVVRPNQLLDAITVAWAKQKPASVEETLDLSPNSSVPSSPSPSGASSTTLPSPRLKTHALYRVLLAEDNPVNQRVASLHLKKIGCSVDCVASGREAVDMFQKLPYDCIFMDVLMPDMDGFEATKKIRELQQHANRIPIVALTANAMPGDRERCLAAGMDDYISKPIQVAELRRVLQTWLHADQARAAVEKISLPENGK